MDEQNLRGKQEKKETRARLREIVRVLTKHKLLQGPTPEKLRAAIEDLGPTFVKLGQILSMRSDILPPAYCEELQKLRAEVKPMPLSEVEAVLASEYGCPLGEVFAAFGREPLGSASIAQAHSAVLRRDDGLLSHGAPGSVRDGHGDTAGGGDPPGMDGGGGSGLAGLPDLAAGDAVGQSGGQAWETARPPDGIRVVVKVQRPGIRAVMERDVKLLHKAVKLLRRAPGVPSAFDFDMMLDEMWAAARDEMDFLREAENLREFARLNDDVAYVGCPQVYGRYSTERVLVMEQIDGIEIDDVGRLEAAGYDPREVAAKLAENYVGQIVDDAFFHADPHPGNIRVRDGKIIWIDLGMVGRLTERDRDLVRRAVVAVAQNDTGELKNVLLTLGVHEGKINHPRLYGDIDDLLMQYGSLELSQLNLGKLMEDLLGLANDHGISVPPGVTMLGRGMVTLEGVLRGLDPEISVVAIMANHMTGDLLGRADLSKTLAESGRALLASGRKALLIPGELSDILRMTIKGQTKLNLELTGSDEPLDRLDGMVDKLVAALVMAAGLVGSSLLCTTNMRPRVLDIPLLGVLGFLGSFVLGGWLLWRIHRKKRR